MTNHLWFMGGRASGKSTMARALQAEEPENARLLSGQSTPAGLAAILNGDQPPRLVILDIDDEEDANSWAVVLHNATAHGGHMVFEKGRSRYRLKVPDGCQIAVFSPPIKDAHVARMASDRGCFQFAVIGMTAAALHVTEGPLTAAAIAAATDSGE
ncbi:MAG: hypothetical protein H7Y60_09745 [Rhodospirillaceae bacterium]|nr:hypothetical protein [Rhodospirillales bacterium]